MIELEILVPNIQNCARNLGHYLNRCWRSSEPKSGLYWSVKLLNRLFDMNGCSNGNNVICTIMRFDETSAIRIK